MPASANAAPAVTGTSGIIPADLWEGGQHRREAIAEALRESGLLDVTRRTQARYVLTGVLAFAPCVA